MFRIKTIMNESRDKVRVYDTTEDTLNNYYTIITGDNASGKSSLLSKAINFFLFENKKDDYLEPAIDLAFLSDKKPSKIIALCNSRFDKFTSNIVFNKKFNQKINTNSMFYIHPEINENSRKGIASVVDQCLKNSLRHKNIRGYQRFTGVNEAFMMFGLQPLLHLKCNVHTQSINYILAMLSNLITGNMELSADGIIYVNKNKLPLDDELKNRDANLDEAMKFIWTEIKNNSDPHLIFDILLMLLEGKFTAENIGDIYFSIADGRIYSEGKNLFTDFTDIDVIKLLFILDVFHVYDFQVMHLNSSKEVSIASLSSGQRTLFGHAIVLSSFVENNCMICIDEPENSLHPEWQLNFMRFISLLCPESLEGHILIATHSPQIISGMQFDNGCVLSLFKKNNLEHVHLRKEHKYDDEKFYELQPLKIYREQSADKQLTGVFKSPGFKNDFIIRKLLLILSKTSKKIVLTHVDREFIDEISTLIEKNRIPEGDPVHLLLKQICSFLKVGTHDDD